MSGAEKKSFDIQEFIESLGQLDPENIGSWPLGVKIGAAVLVLAGMIFGCYMVLVTDEYRQLGRLQRTEADLMTQYESKAFKAQNLNQYRKQLDDMEDMFGSLLAQLPKETEVPGLLEDITHTGLGSGMEFKEIKLGTESVKEFYAELPIQIDAQGDYHGFGAFVSGVAALPRIVTLGDFSIKPVDAKTSGGGLLALSITAKTYRYSSGPPASDTGKKGKKSSKRGGKKR